MRVLVYEHLTAGGLPDEQGLLQEGAAMLAAALADLATIPGVEAVPVQARSRFAAAAESCDAALVIAPEYDNILASLADWFDHSRCRLLGPDGGAVRLTGDKLALADHLARAGVPTPKARALPASVVKPRHGCGCRDTHVFDGEFIIQDHVIGRAVSVAFAGGTPLRACAQEISEGGGRLAYRGGSLPLPHDLERRAVSLACRAADCVPGLAGYFGVDLILGEEGDHVIEINPRLTTSYLGLRALCRNNLMAVLLGLDTSPLVWRRGIVTFTPDGIVEHKEAP
jgi:predicted ATP-grasp superfamily ATP-dependent carboligase